MLRVCKKIQVDHISETGLKKKNNSILEVYFEIFLNELEQLVKKGLIKKYKRIENNQLSLKGKLVFSKNILSGFCKVLILFQNFFSVCSKFSMERLMFP